MTDPAIVTNRMVFSASHAVEALARSLSRIKSEDGLTFADMGAVLGKSGDQAAKYCDGSATMDAVTFGRAKREWNGRFTGEFDRLCEESRPAAFHPRECESTILKAALALSVALQDGQLTRAEVLQNRSTLENAKDAIAAVLGSLGPTGEVRA